MSKHVLILPIYKTERGEQVINVDKALDSLDQGIRKLNYAVENPRSQEGDSWLAEGFVSIILHGVKGDEAVEFFHKGGCKRIADNGRSVIFDPPCPMQNAQEALACLRAAYKYTLWVKAVEKAAVEDRRPPVFDTLEIGPVPDSIREWIGQNAEAYFSAWQEEHSKKAMALLSQQPAAV
jgi:hypothetical protein